MEELLIMIYMIRGAANTEKLRSKQLDLTEDMKNKIMEEGLYHITSKETAEKIIECGYMLPSKGILNNHFARSRYGDKFADFAYMFAGKPTVEMAKANLGHIASADGTMYAVKHTPDQYEINNYTERMEDGAITYEGRLDIANSKPELVRMKFEKGKLVEIPWDEPVQEDPISKFKGTQLMGILGALKESVKKIGKNALFRDKDGKLKQCIANRRAEKKMLQQYNNDTNKKEFKILKNGIEYEISTIGAKINDGKPLMGFRIQQEGTEFSKNVFMDLMDITEITDQNLGVFLGNYMNEESVRTEYIGKPILKDGKVTQSIDQGYAHHFYEKQLMTVKNDATYAQYIASEKAKKQEQLKSLYENFSAIPARMRNEVIGIIKTTKERGLTMLKDSDRDKNSGLVLGG